MAFELKITHIAHSGLENCFPWWQRFEQECMRSCLPSQLYNIYVIDMLKKYNCGLLRGQQTLVFDTEEDASLFVLKWS